MSEKERFKYWMLNIPETSGKQSKLLETAEKKY